MSNPSSGLPVGRGLLFLIVAGVAWGTAGAGAALVYRISDLGPVALSFWRCAVGLVLLLAVRPLRPRPCLRPLLYPRLLPRHPRKHSRPMNPPHHRHRIMAMPTRAL